MNGGKASTSAFCQMQFFEELAQTRIAVATGMNSFASSKIIQLNAALCSAIADYFNHIRHDVHLYRLVLVISTMIIGVHQTFLQSLIRIVIYHDRMLIVLWLMDVLPDNHILQIVQCPS